MRTLLTDHPLLLGAWHARRSTDLRSHVEHHGPLPTPTRDDRHWPQRFAALLADSGLTGRGGASFPSASKLDSLRARGRTGTLVVNAMEGEPASMKDRVLLDYAPHLVLDGAELVALAVGARRIVVCTAEDRADCVTSVNRASEERARYGLRQVPIEVTTAPGRYISGEESALVRWLDGEAAVPSFRADKSVPVTIGRQDALVHNAETLAHAALIARHGFAWFRQMGTDDSPGTSLVTVSGSVDHPGVYETELGTPLDAIARRARPSGKVAAALVGGYGGTWVAGRSLDTPYAKNALCELGGSIGPGVLVIVDGSVCGLAETARICRYMAGESAGQCGPCVFGLPAIANDMWLVATGAADHTIISRLRRRLDLVEGRGACRHPDGTAHMVKSALRAFSDDLAGHLSGRPCAHSGRATVLTLPVRRTAPIAARRR